MRVRPESWEHSPDKAGFYAGIYSVTIGHAIEVYFVPRFGRDVVNWPPKLPENADDVSSFDEARIMTCIFSELTVTVGDAATIPEVLEFPSTFYEGKEYQHRSVIWNVTDEAFADFDRELVICSETASALRSDILLGEFFDFSCIRFILTTIVDSRFCKYGVSACLARQDYK
ncbi:MAG TPA: hypothetical protein VFE47_23435 [Tepidisphaeraceae bacterium]|nr:hypothetical protein [Tepidisphaeraceae bacterium]